MARLGAVTIVFVAAALAVALALPSLDPQVPGSPFPDWEAQGWTVVGSRSGQVDGRETTTVYYENDGRFLHLSIVEGGPLEDDRTRVVVRGDKRFLTSEDSVAWRRGHQSCVLSGDGVPPDQLVELAVNA